MEDYNPQQTMYQRPPKSWLVESILVTIFCCLPFGIAGIVYASRVETRYYGGDVEGAIRASDEAKKWTLIGFSIGLLIAILYIAMIAFGMFAGLTMEGLNQEEYYY